MVNYGRDFKYYRHNKDNIKTPGIKSLHANLREMPFDGQIIKLQFIPR